jgi:Bacterial membrane protein YfhO
MSDSTPPIDFPPDQATSWEIVPEFRWWPEIRRGGLLGVGVVLVLLIHQLFVPGFALVDDDAVSSCQPVMTDFARQLHSGTFPVWSHHTSCGYPLLGWPQPSFTYPPMWIAHAVGSLLGIDSGDFLIVTFGHYWLAAAATFVYLRRFGVHPLAAETGALGNTLAGVLLGLGACWPTYVFTAAMWPLVFLTIEELRAGRAFWFWTLLLGLIGGLAFLYLDAMVMIKFTTFAGLYLLLRLDRTSWRRLLEAVVIAGAIAIVIGLVQTVPSTEIIVTSQRMGEGSNNHFAVGPMLWLGLLFPYAVLPWEVGEQSFRAAGGFFVGPCALLGLIAGLRWFRLAGPHRVLWILAVVYLLLAVGERSLLSNLVQRLPVFHVFRWPFRWTFEASTALALLGGFGLHLVGRRPERSRLVVLSFVAIMVVGTFATMHFNVPRLHHGWGKDAVHRTAPYMYPLWWILLTVLVASIFIPRRGWITCVVFGWTAAAMIVNLPVAQMTRMARMTHLVDDPLEVGKDSQDRVLFLARHSEVLAAQNEGNLAMSLPHRIPRRAVLGYVYRPPGQAWMNPIESDGLIFRDDDVIARRFLGPDSSLLSTLRVGHVVVPRSNKILVAACDAQDKLRFDHETDWYRIYRHVGFHEGAFFVRSLKREKEPDDIVELGERIAIPPQALIEPSYDGPTWFDEGLVKDFDEEHGHLSMTTASGKEGFVVVTTTWFPRWRATVDGSPTPIYRVNGSFLGIRVPAGEHRVELVYWPSDHVWLAVLSGLAFVATCVALFWTRG